MLRSTTATPIVVVIVTLLASSFSRALAGRDVRITYTDEDGSVHRKNFDLLVVACAPSSLSGVFDGRTELEERVDSSLEYFTFGTTLWDVKRGKGKDNAYTVRAWVDKLKEANGEVYAFRDEARARTARARRHTLLTVYQFANRTMGQEELTGKVSVALGGSDPSYNAVLGLESVVPEPLETFRVDYFPHFSQDDLQAGMPWEILDAQGSHSTIYVSSFASFESVLSVYDYGNMLEASPRVQEAIESAKASSTKPQVAVIGAGPSGLLFVSQQLKRAGLTDVTIFEKEDRIGGKTNTKYYKTPGYPNKKKVPVELGTCYLSSRYSDFAVQMENEYRMQKPVRMNYAAGDLGPRVMLDSAGFGELEPYFLWILRHPNGTMFTQEELSAGVSTYIAAHYSLVGWSMAANPGFPIPPSQPEDLPDMSFLQYLNALDIGYLENSMVFAQTFQGYGQLAEIPAYYGLIWMTPEVYLGEIETAASISEQLAAGAALDAETGLRLKQGAQTLRHGAKVGRMFQEQASKEFQSGGARPSMEETTALAARCHQHVLAGEGEEEEEEDDIEVPLDSVYLFQEGWGELWDKIVFREGLKSKIKLNVDITKIERRGLGSY